MTAWENGRTDAQTARMLERLPTAWQGGEAFRALLGAVSPELVALDQGALRLARSRHLWGAQGWGAADPDDARAQTELGRLGAGLGLLPHAGESARAFRVRIAALMTVHRGGLGSADALLQLAALALGAETLPEVHLRVVDDEVHADASASVRDGTGRRVPIALSLEDNPPVPWARTWTGIQPGAAVEVDHGGAAPAALTILLSADVALTCPLLRASHGVGVLYPGVVPAGTTLLIDPWGARLDGIAAQRAVIPLCIDLFDNKSSTWAGDQGGARYASLLPLDEALRQPATPGTWEIQLLSPGAAGALYALTGRPVPADLLEPDLGPEEDAWLETVPPESRFDLCLLGDETGPSAVLVGAPPSVQDHAAVSRAQPRCTLQLRALAREPATFALTAPGDLLPQGIPDTVALGRALRDAADYGRAAGIRARVRVRVQAPAEEVPAPEDRLAVLGYTVHEALGVEDRWTATVRVSMQDGLALSGAVPDAPNLKLNSRSRGQLDRSQLGAAHGATFDAVALDRNALQTARDLVLDRGPLGREALGLAGSEGAHPVPPIERALVLDTGQLEKAPLGAAAPAVFAPGLTLDRDALGRGLATGVFGHVRFGATGHSAHGEPTPPEWQLLRTSPTEAHAVFVEDLALDPETPDPLRIPWPTPPPLTRSPARS